MIADFTDSKERARNNFNNLVHLPQGDGWGDGIKCTSYFVRVPKQD